jgi:nucleotide-binding universal stress UspA family protein
LTKETSPVTAGAPTGAGASCRTIVRRPMPDGCDGEHSAMRKSVVGVDGSRGATEALRVALEEAAVSGAAVTAVTAWDVPPGSYGAPKSVALAHEFFEQEGQRHLDRCLESAGVTRLGVAVERRLVKGDARRILCSAAESADMLVLGSRGLGTVRSLLLGSVGMYCVHHAPCPVVIVPLRGQDEEEVSPR